MSTPTILCKTDGPYLVKGLTDLRNSRGERLPADAVVALCQCGGSATKPFCDSTHKKNGFSGTRATDGSADRRDKCAEARASHYDIGLRPTFRNVSDYVRFECDICGADQEVRHQGE